MKMWRSVVIGVHAQYGAGKANNFRHEKMIVQWLHRVKAANKFRRRYFLKSRKNFCSKFEIGWKKNGRHSHVAI